MGCLWVDRASALVAMHKCRLGKRGNNNDHFSLQCLEYFERATCDWRLVLIGGAKVTALGF